MEFNSLPTDIISFCILPNLYKSNLLNEHFTGDPETGYLHLKNAWDAPHLSIINQLQNISELRKVNVELSRLVKHPFELSFRDKLDFAKASIANIDFTSKIRRKIIYKIANRIKPKNTNKVIEIIHSDYHKKIKYNKLLLHQEMKNKFEPKPYNFSNDTCLFCYGILPAYYPSIRKNWNRCVAEGYNPHYLRKRVCSRRCYKKSLSQFICAKCAKNCKPGTDFQHEYDSCSFTLMLINPETAETSPPKYITSSYSSAFTCSIECLGKIKQFHKEFDNKNVLIRSAIIPIVYGFVIDNDILTELQGSSYITKDVVRILNPDVEDFIP
jgi:hypothetical protein